MRSGFILLAAAAACLFTALAAAALPAPPVPPQNPITEPKRVLGKMLFWDEQLSSDRTIACGTCHQFRQAGSDPRPATNPGLDLAFGTADDVSGSAGVVRRNAAGQPIADPVFGSGVQVTPRHSQSILGALWAPDLFWDGRARSTFVDPQTGLTSIPAGGGLESQSLVPILAANEMATDNRTWPDVVDRLIAAKPMALATYVPADVKAALASNPSYPQLFALAFGTPVVTAERIAFALATYQRTLIADQTPFDLGTLTPQQQQGLAVFNAPFSSCGVCHVAPVFTDNTFRNIGVRPLAEDVLGRQVVTSDALDAGRFKVPTLRNVGLKNFFMHNGRQTTLEQVMDFYLQQNGEIQFPENRDPLMALITMGKSQSANLIEFMRNGLADPRVAAGAFPFDQPILKSERGDANRDGKVDATDRTQFLACYTGPGPAAVAAGCERLDMDGDADIDCGDWPLFAAAWTAAAPPEAPAACAVAILAPATPVPVLAREALVALALLLAAGALLALRRRG